MFYLHMCLCTMCVHIHQVYKTKLDPLELEVHLCVTMWVFGIELQSSGGASACNY